ncbi:MAG: cbb3-type cytochrome c oxidase subunit I [Proteobacteria bacterium]|nr:cbb3-type cytochrome c oxidase subunit I [Pseudomonadota bacterium]
MNKHTKRFIASALIYFFIGCSLGLLAVASPDLVYQIRPIHAHINLLGWVSMMIIGVTYFVIPVFVRKYPYSDRAVTLHLILANAGIIGMSVSFLVQSDILLAISSVLEVASAYLFLFNIISTAIKGAPVKEEVPEGLFLMGDNDKTVDKWSSSFTQAATFYFVIGCTLGGYVAISPGGWSLFRVHFHITLLGWVAMMIFGVAYHIFPRFSGNSVRNPSLVKINYRVANTGIILMALALIYAEKGDNALLANYATGLAGLIEGAAGLIFVYNILPSVVGAERAMGKASVRFVLVSLFYFVLAIIMGVCMTIHPSLAGEIMPVHAHLNVLGWITMMIFGVGYYMIPEFAGKRLYSQKLATIHFWIANIGLIGFLCLLPFRDEDTTALITTFALMEFASAFLFIFNILKSLTISKKVQRT